MQKRAQSTGTPSVYSHTTRSTGTGARTARSTKSLQVPWYRRPIVTDLLGFDIQQLSIFTSVYSFVLSLFTIATSCFDLYCLSEAAPGKSHTGYYIISFDFVYVGNIHVRNTLIAMAVFSLLGATVLFVTTIQLIQALRKEHERKMVPWMVTMLMFTVWRVFSFIFAAVVNDMIFSYNIFMCFAWIILTILSLAGFASVYSLFLELSDLTKLEDLAHLRKMGTMASLTTHSIAGSRPTTPHTPHTPHSTTSTMPVP